MCVVVTDIDESDVVTKVAGERIGLVSSIHYILFDPTITLCISVEPINCLPYLLGKGV